MRLDLFLLKNNIFDSRNKASEAIKRGEIKVDGVTIVKPSYDVDLEKTCNVDYVYDQKFVSLGGYKLKKAINDFSLVMTNKIVCDIGASTGGFTDCALQHGAKKVYAVDLNDTLLHNSLKSNPKVVPIIKNAKDLLREDFLDNIDVICADLSFISATQVMHVFYDLLDCNGYAVLLIKPQFEMNKHVKHKNGIIRDEKLRQKACQEVCECATNLGFIVKAITNAPIYENKNIEYLALLEKKSI